MTHPWNDYNNYYLRTKGAYLICQVSPLNKCSDIFLIKQWGSARKYNKVRNSWELLSASRSRRGLHSDWLSSSFKWKALLEVVIYILLPACLDLWLLSNKTFRGGEQCDFQPPQDDLLNMKNYIPIVQNYSVFNHGHKSFNCQVMNICCLWAFVCN